MAKPKPDPAAYQDHLWAEWCAREELLDGLDPGDPEDPAFDGDALPPPGPPPDRSAPSPELAALITELAAREQREERFLDAWRANDGATVISMLPLSTLRDPGRLEGLIELARRHHPPPAEPERPFQPPYHDPSHELAGHQAPPGYVSHGPQFIGDSQTSLEKLHAAFRAKAGLLAQYGGLEGMAGNIAGAMAPEFNARLREIESEIEYLGKLLNLDPGQLHQLDLRFESVARRELAKAAALRARGEPAAERRGPARITAGWPTDYLGRPRVEQAPKEHPESGWSVPDSKPAARPRGRRVRAGRPRYRMRAARSA